MTLPSFIGIGGKRCGSTWLHKLLLQHPKIYMPIKRKEVNFFDANYDKGLGWYESFFPSESDKEIYQAIGEMSPQYLTNVQCPKRIASVQSIRKLIVILRNPVDRAYSHYGLIIRSGSYKKSFEYFILDYPYAITEGFYSTHLNSFLEYFSREQLCCLIFEESVNDLLLTQTKIENFLNLKSDNFSWTVVQQKIKESYSPQFSQLAKISTKARNYLRDSDLDWIVNFANTMGFQKMLKLGRTSLPKIKRETRLRLQDTFYKDIEKLEGILERNLDIWRLNN
jgi:hypothetical protein